VAHAYIHTHEVIEVTETVVLELSQAEAKLVLDVLGKCGGAPTPTNRRDMLNDSYSTLRTLGIEYARDRNEGLNDLHGSLHFTSEATNER